MCPCIYKFIHPSVHITRPCPFQLSWTIWKIFIKLWWHVDPTKMVCKTNSISMQAQGQGQNHKSMEAAIYKILINFQSFLKSNRIPNFITNIHFSCHLRIMLDTYGPCLHRHHRLLRCPRCNTFGFRSITFEGIHQFHSNFTEVSTIIKYRSSLKGWQSAKFDLVMTPFFT